MNTTRSHRSWLVIVVFLLLAGVTRFYRLDWSLWGDEAWSFAEVKSLLEKPFFLPSITDADYLGRAIPIGVALQALTYQVFGTSEWQARMGVAIAGTLAIPLIVWFVAALSGHTTAMILGGILLFSPWHLFESQNNRIYSFAFLFVSVALLAAALAWKQKQRSWAIVAGILSAVALATFNFTILLPLGLGTFVVAERLLWKTPLPWRIIRTYLLSGGPLLLVSLAFAIIARQHWNGETPWGYSSLHTLLGLAFNLNWEIALFSGVGCLWCLWLNRDSTERLWVVLIVISVASALIAPRFTDFRPEYLFPMTLPFFLVTARMLAYLYELLKRQSRLLAMACVSAVLLGPLPSWISYYADGNRYDYRAAAQFILKHQQPGDIIAADWPGIMRYYTQGTVKAADDVTRGFQPITTLEQYTVNGQRLWLVVTLNRQELTEEVEHWLWQHAVRMTRIKQKRFDYHENITDVYLISPAIREGKP